MNDGETVIDFITVLLFPMRNNSQFERHKFMENIMRYVLLFCRRISFLMLAPNVKQYFSISSYSSSWPRQLCEHSAALRHCAISKLLIYADASRTVAQERRAFLSLRLSVLKLAALMQTYVGARFRTFFTSYLWS